MTPFLHLFNTSSIHGGSNQKMLKGVYWQYEAALNFKKIYIFFKNSPQTLNFQEVHLCSAYCRQFKTFPTFPITPCRYFQSSPQSSAIGNQHSHIPWHTKTYFLLNWLAAALARLVFLHLIPYNLCSWKFSSKKQLQIFFSTYPRRPPPAMPVWSKRVSQLIRTKIYQASWQQGRKKE